MACVSSGQRAWRGAGPASPPLSPTSGRSSLVPSGSSGGRIWEKETLRPAEVWNPARHHAGGWLSGHVLDLGLRRLQVSSVGSSDHAAWQRGQCAVAGEKASQEEATVLDARTD
ncbi:unnamed protein product [Rangifer tarandus platyrhynchus]|uniref:Uncharacterized protein n=3 Tax=Rangifer tarandus platyrhynchus TaxID=3082113 RepID=A0AC59YRU6_RANTA|nr:unnamed protein product [Rangifer tarandus platyrhynchus]CAI9698873.1 unnamed protein product [Rangifer tarandus platyrhynchus]